MPIGYIIKLLPDDISHNQHKSILCRHTEVFAIDSNLKIEPEYTNPFHSNGYSQTYSFNEFGKVHFHFKGSQVKIS